MELKIYMIEKIFLLDLYNININIIFLVHYDYKII